MSMGHWEPYGETRMNDHYPSWTICETLRRIYNKSEDGEVKYLCRIATSMAKHMVDKLQEYNTKFNEETWLEKTEDMTRQLDERT
jgi:hypothetical protein